MKTDKAKRKSAGHGLVFDIIFIILILGLIGAGLILILLPEEQESVLIEYRVEFDTVKKEVAANISVNSDFLNENGESMGTVFTALIDDKIIEVPNRIDVQNIEYKKHNLDEYRTVKATVKALAIPKNGGYYVCGLPIRAGEELVLRQPYFYGTANVLAVRVLEEE